MALGAKDKFGAPLVEPAPHGRSLAPLWWNLSSFESKFAVLNKVLVTLLGLFGDSRSDSAPPHSQLAPGEFAPPSLHLCLYCIVYGQ